MRNLKKILALVLALVMSLSLVTTAGAFSDDGDINASYDDAITVLSGLDVFKGYSDGSFQPKGTITRAEVAAIIYRIATGDVTDAQASIYSTYGQFTDVADGAWYAGYVNYCANAQYIKGRGNKIFDPQGKVTGYEALAMILRAVGYDKNGEFSGTNWQIRTASIANERGITKNVTEALLGQAASRELVAEILFRSIVIPKVNFNTNTLSYNEKPLNADGKKDTLGYEKLKLEEITGVVTANEYADLDSSETLADGRTRMVVDGADKQIYNLEYSSGLDDIGESRSAYIVNGNLSKVLLLADSGDNVVYDDGVKKSAKDAAKDKGLSLTDDTEYYRNYDPMRKWQAKVRIEYVIEENMTEYAAIARRIDNNKSGTLTLSGSTTPITKELADASLTTMNTYVYTNVIKADDYLTAIDRNIIDKIFREADRETVGGYVTGEVFVYTSSVSGNNEDISDKISRSEFYAQYVNAIENNKSIDGDNPLGYRLKVIDNNNDAKADYVLQTVYTVTKVEKVGDDSKYTFKTAQVDMDSYDSWNNVGKDIKTHVMTGNSLSVGDVVLYANIDGKAAAWLAESATAKIDKVNRAADPRTATTADGTEYKDSSVNVKPNPGTFEIALGDDVLNLIGGTTYTLYFDLYGNLAAFNEADEQFVLLVDGWYNQTKGGVEYAVKAWIDGKIQTKDVNASGELFIGEDANDTQNNAWGQIKPLGRTDYRNGTAADTGNLNDRNGGDIKTTVAMLRDDGTLTPVDTAYNSLKQTAIIAMDNNALPGADNNGVTGMVYNTRGVTYDGTREAYNDRVNLDDTLTSAGKQFVVRPMSNTKYYFVYNVNNYGATTVNSREIGKVVQEYVGYQNLPQNGYQSHIEDVYVVGTAAQSATRETYYAADIVVVELDNTYYNNQGGEIVFVSAIPSVGSNITIDNVDVIRWNGTKETVSVNLVRSGLNEYDEAGDAQRAGLYRMVKIDENDVYYIKRMSPDDIANSNSIHTGVVDQSQIIMRNEYVSLRRFGRTNVNNVPVMGQIETFLNGTAVNVVSDCDVADSSKYYTFTVNDRGYGELSESTISTVLNGDPKQWVDNRTSDWNDLRLKDTDMNDNRYQWNEVLVVYETIGNTRYIKYAVSFDEKDNAQAVWYGCMPSIANYTSINGLWATVGMAGKSYDEAVTLAVGAILATKADVKANAAAKAVTKLAEIKSDTKAFDALNEDLRNSIKTLFGEMIDTVADAVKNGATTDIKTTAQDALKIVAELAKENDGLLNDEQKKAVTDATGIVITTPVDPVDPEDPTSVEITLNFELVYGEGENDHEPVTVKNNKMTVSVDKDSKAAVAETDVKALLKNDNTATDDSDWYVYSVGGVKVAADGKFNVTIDSTKTLTVKVGLVAEDPSGGGDPSGPVWTPGWDRRTRDASDGKWTLTVTVEEGKELASVADYFPKAVFENMDTEGGVKDQLAEKTGSGKQSFKVLLKTGYDPTKGGIRIEFTTKPVGGVDPNPPSDSKLTIKCANKAGAPIADYAKYVTVSGGEKLEANKVVNVLQTGIKGVKVTINGKNDNYAHVVTEDDVKNGLTVDVKVEGGVTMTPDKVTLPDGENGEPAKTIDTLVKGYVCPPNSTAVFTFTDVYGNPFTCTMETDNSGKTALAYSNDGTVRDTRDISKWVSTKVTSVTGDYEIYSDSTVAVRNVTVKGDANVEIEAGKSSLKLLPDDTETVKVTPKEGYTVSAALINSGKTAGVTAAQDGKGVVLTIDGKTVQNGAEIVIKSEKEITITEETAELPEGMKLASENATETDDGAVVAELELNVPEGKNVEWTVTQNGEELAENENGGYTVVGEKDADGNVKFEGIKVTANEEADVDAASGEISGENFKGSPFGTETTVLDEAGLKLDEETKADEFQYTNSTVSSNVNGEIETITSEVTNESGNEMSIPAGASGKGITLTKMAAADTVSRAAGDRWLLKIEVATARANGLVDNAANGKIVIKITIRVDTKNEDNKDLVAARDAAKAALKAYVDKEMKDAMGGEGFAFVEGYGFTVETIEDRVTNSPSPLNDLNLADGVKEIEAMIDAAADTTEVEKIFKKDETTGKFESLSWDSGSDLDKTVNAPGGISPDEAKAWLSEQKSLRANFGYGGNLQDFIKVEAQMMVAKQNYLNEAEKPDGKGYVPGASADTILNVKIKDAPDAADKLERPKAGAIANNYDTLCKTNVLGQMKAAVETRTSSTIEAENAIEEAKTALNEAVGEYVTYYSEVAEKYNAVLAKLTTASYETVWKNGKLDDYPAAEIAAVAAASTAPVAALWDALRLAQSEKSMPNMMDEDGVAKLLHDIVLDKTWKNTQSNAAVTAAEETVEGAAKATAESITKLDLAGHTITVADESSTTISIELETTPLEIVNTKPKDGEGIVRKTGYGIKISGAAGSLTVGDGVRITVDSTSNQMCIFVAKDAAADVYIQSGAVLTQKGEAGTGLWVLGTCEASKRVVVSGEIKSEGLGLYTAGKNMRVDVKAGGVVYGKMCGINVSGGNLTVRAGATVGCEKDPSELGGKPNQGGTSSIGAGIIVEPYADRSVSVEVMEGATVYGGEFAVSLTKEAGKTWAETGEVRVPANIDLDYDRAVWERDKDASTGSVVVWKQVDTSSGDDKASTSL